MSMSNSNGISITTTLTITIACIAIIFIVLKYTLPSSLLPDKTFHYAYAQKQEKSPDIGSLSLSNLIDQGSPHLGSKSAPVTVIDFSDFQCYLCNRFVKATEPRLNATYVQTGKVSRLLVSTEVPRKHELRSEDLFCTTRKFAYVLFERSCH